MITMRTNTIQKQTGIRFNPRVLARAKYAARLANTSLNEYINSLVEKATEDIRTEEEIEEERKRTLAFLEECGGSWSGPDSAEKIKAIIKEGRTVREPLAL